MYRINKVSYFAKYGFILNPTYHAYFPTWKNYIVENGKRLVFLDRNFD